MEAPEFDEGEFFHLDRGVVSRRPHPDEALGDARQGRGGHPAARIVEGADGRRLVSATAPRFAPELAELVDRPLAPEEFERRIRAPLDEREVEDAATLVRWFTGRYPTVAERFADVRRAWRRWDRPVRIETP
jgi:hypothetical protein